MYGIISNNLTCEITNYLIDKNIEIKVNINKPIGSSDLDGVKNKLAQINLECVIIDSSSFYQDKLLIDLIYYIKTNHQQTRVILVSFSKSQLTDAATLGIYDIILYTKKINLAYELDDLLLKPKTLSDIKEFLNVQIIQSQKNSNSINNIILSVGLQKLCFATSFWNGYANIMAKSSDKKICIVELANKNSELEVLFGGAGYATIDDLTKPIFTTEDYYIVFSNEVFITEELLLRLILNLSQNFDEVILDLPSSELHLYDLLIQNVSKIYMFDRVNIYNDNIDLKRKIKEDPKFVKLINQDDINYKHNINTLDKYYNLHRDLITKTFFEQKESFNILKYIKHKKNED